MYLLPNCFENNHNEFKKKTLFHSKTISFAIIIIAAYQNNAGINSVFKDSGPLTIFSYLNFLTNLLLEKHILRIYGFRKEHKKTIKINFNLTHFN